MRKFNTVILIFCSCLVSLSLHAEQLEVAYFIVPPHVIEDGEQSGKPKGTAIDFFEKIIAPEMEVTIKWRKVAVGIPRQLKMLEEGKIDAGVIFAKNKERAKFLNYPKYSFYDSRSVLAVTKNHPLKQVEKIEDILDYRIGYSAKAFKSPFMRDKRIKWDYVYTRDWINQSLKKLLINRLDAMYVVEAPPILYAARKNQAEDKIRLIFLPEPKTAIYTTFSKKSAPDLAQRYEKAFEKVGGQKRYYKMLAEHIDVSSL